MRTIIPFVADLPDSEIESWLEVLAQEVPEADFVPFNRLKDRAGHTLAAVANPDPKELAMLPDLTWVQSLWAGVEKLIYTTAITPQEITLGRAIASG